MIINDLDGYYIVFDTKNWNTELDTLIINLLHNCDCQVIIWAYSVVLSRFKSF